MGHRACASHAFDSYLKNALADPYGVVELLHPSGFVFKLNPFYFIPLNKIHLDVRWLRDRVSVAEAAFYLSLFTPMPMTGWKLQPIGFQTDLEKQGKLSLTNGCRPPSWRGGSQG